MFNAGNLNKKIEIWKNNLVKNEDYEMEPMPTLVKTVWAQIIPKTGSLLTGRPAETMLSKTTHLVKMRYLTAKEIKPDYWFIYKEKISETETTEHRFDIDYIQNPLFDNDAIEVYCQEVV